MKKSSESRACLKRRRGCCRFRRRRAAWLAALAGIISALPSARACAVCFGKSDAPLAKAMNMGIFAMLLVVAFMWAAFAAFILYLRRQAARTRRRAEAAQAIAELEETAEELDEDSELVGRP